MKFYKSTAGCGYKQYAYVTPIAKNKNGNDYLCIWTNENSDKPIHVIGEVVEDLEDIYLQEVELNVNDFELGKSFLFKFFVENFSFETVPQLGEVRDFYPLNHKRSTNFK